ncbi:MULTISPECIES: hypothetical protein [unclassified Herbaspirillum]|uniref:hypothetical protein n=1 Tax=unclassified Herbaspirillum TaxID=2624150 RepID=UPI00115127DA|nr:MULTISPECIES: hypothetical protein [unclassified Herbaspirillum]MBB5391377.1 hypothetical protein [Herbaspirillum sp. SJZ102]TQK12937.1 hypothetical protein FB599_0344 [Herbaspirillum sp. SJZ130]TQK14941.1 hypothetical protein FB598_0282 [Herbaspirillum sp. SJZ106]TWC67296.1 hypothetical protein FB597_104106 [Herbaspirillum sp. SJZ099]
MQDNDVSGELPDNMAAMLEELFSSMKRPLLEAGEDEAGDLAAVPAAPLAALPEPGPDEALMRPEVLAGMIGDPRFADDFERLRSEAEQGFTALLNDAQQWVPVGVSSAVSGNLRMGAAMEVRDLMAASRRNLAGSGSNHDERRLMAQYLAVAGIHNFNEIGWDPANPVSYAEEGGNLLSVLLSSPSV